MTRRRARRLSAGGARTLDRLLALALGLGLTSHAHAEDAATRELPEELQVVIEHCAAPAFDTEAFEHALSLELFALGVGEPAELGGAAGPAAATDPPATDAPSERDVPELRVATPGCGPLLQLTLRVRGGEHVDTLRSDELGGEGKERALALATIERLQLAWPSLARAAEQKSKAAARDTAASLAKRSGDRAATAPAAAPPLEPERDAGGRGALSVALGMRAADYPLMLTATLDDAVSRVLSLGVALSFHAERMHQAGLAIDGNAVVVGPRLELSLWSSGGLSVATSLAALGGLGFASFEGVRESNSDYRASSPAALLALGTLGLSARSIVMGDAYLQLGVEVGHTFLGARFVDASGAVLARMDGLHGAASVGFGLRLGD